MAECLWRSSMPWKRNLCLIKHHAMKTLEIGGITPRDLNLGTRLGEWSSSRPSRFTPGERVPGTRRVGGWVGPRAGLDAVVKRKTPSPAGNRTPVVQSGVNSLFTLSGVLIHFKSFKKCCNTAWWEIYNNIKCWARQETGNCILTAEGANKFQDKYFLRCFPIFSFHLRNLIWPNKSYWWNSTPKLKHTNITSVCEIWGNTAMKIGVKFFCVMTQHYLVVTPCLLLLCYLSWTHPQSDTAG